MCGPGEPAWRLGHLRKVLAAGKARRNGVRSVFPWLIWNSTAPTLTSKFSFTLSFAGPASLIAPQALLLSPPRVPLIPFLLRMSQASCSIDTVSFRLGQRPATFSQNSFQSIQQTCCVLCTNSSSPHPHLQCCFQALLTPPPSH